MKTPLYSRLGLLVGAALTLHAVGVAQTPDLSNNLSGAEMMEELIRLTQVPLGDAPLDFKGHLAYQITRGAKSGLGELRWAQDELRLMWTDHIELQGQYTLLKDSDSPLATVHLLNHEGSFMSPEMMVVAGYWSEESSVSRREMKKDKKSSESPIMSHLCEAFVGKEGKERVVVWLAPVFAAPLTPDEYQAYRKAFEGWMDCRPDRVLRNIDLPEGLPLKVEWGIPDDVGNLPSAMEVVTLNPGSEYVLDATQIWMSVPGRDINQVAKEMKEKAAQEKGE